MDENTTSIYLAAIAAIVSIATAIIATFGARKAAGAEQLSRSTDEKTDRLEVKIDGRVDELLSHAVARARAEGAIAGAAASGDRRSQALPGVIGEPSILPTTGIVPIPTPATAATPLEPSAPPADT